MVGRSRGRAEPVEGLGVYDTRARGRGARRPARSAGIERAPQLQVDAMERKQQQCLGSGHVEVGDEEWRIQVFVFLLLPFKFQALSCIWNAHNLHVGRGASFGP
jgi:hypothetical protein